MSSTPVPSEGSADLDGARSRAAKVAMVGAGQLARMTLQAAIDYGIDLHVLAASDDDAAVIAGAAHTLGRPDRYADLAELAGIGEVLTFDHELVSIEHLRTLSRAGVRVRPSAEALQLSCDKLFARRIFDGLGELRVPVPIFSSARTVDDVAAFASDHGWPVILKSRSGGYDGRGVHVLHGIEDARGLLPATRSGDDASWLIEEHLDLAGEFAVLLARNPSGHTAIYPPILTTQEDGICRELTMPADLPASVTAPALRMAESVISGIDATGVCAVEFFWTTDGRVLLNELALRPHNSGHITIEASHTSQFHQHLRGVLDWPLGSTEQVAPAATVNLIGGPTMVDPMRRIRDLQGVPGVHVHLYQKTPRPGRKIGHVTALAETVEVALERARLAAHQLTGD